MNCLVITSCNKKKLKIGNSKVIEKINTCILFNKIFDKLSEGKNPPEDMLVKDKLTESRSLRPTKLYRRIMKIVENK